MVKIQFTVSGYLLASLHEKFICVYNCESVEVKKYFGDLLVCLIVHINFCYLETNKVHVNIVLRNFCI